MSLEDDAFGIAYRREIDRLKARIRELEAELADLRRARAWRVIP